MGIGKLQNSALFELFCLFLCFKYMVLYLNFDQNGKW